jgi:hypothetical protein
METQIKAYKNRVKSLKRVSHHLVVAANSIDYVNDTHFEEKIHDVIGEIEDEIAYLMREINEGAKK